MKNFRIRLNTRRLVKGQSRLHYSFENWGRYDLAYMPLITITIHALFFKVTLSINYGPDSDPKNRHWHP